MSGIFVFIVFIIVISNILKAAKKQTDSKAGGKGSNPAGSTKKSSLSPYEEQRAAREIEQAKTEASRKMAAKRQMPQPAKEEGVMQPDIAPTVATSVRVSPHNHENMFAGSMNADDTGEGKDPCHDNAYASADILHTEEASAYAVEESHPVQAENEIVRAVIWQEILNPPKNVLRRR